MVVGHEVLSHQRQFAKAFASMIRLVTEIAHSGPEGASNQKRRTGVRRNSPDTATTKRKNFVADFGRFVAAGGRANMTSPNGIG